MQENELIKHAINMLIAIMPPVFFAAIGRMMYYAQNKIVPTLRETLMEIIVIMFMGVASGSLGTMLGFEDGIALWGFISVTSYYTPLIIKVVFPKLINKLVGRFMNEIEPVCNFDSKDKNTENK